MREIHYDFVNRWEEFNSPQAAIRGVRGGRILADLCGAQPRIEHVGWRDHAAVIDLRAGGILSVFLRENVVHCDQTTHMNQVEDADDCIRLVHTTGMITEWPRGKMLLDRVGCCLLSIFASHPRIFINVEKRPTLIFDAMLDVRENSYFLKWGEP